MAELSGPAWRTIMKRRLLLAAAALAMWTAAVEARLVYLQIVEHDKWVALAAEQQSDKVEVPGGRGDIVDRRGEPLAVTADVQTVIANPKLVADPVRYVNTLCAALRDCSSADRKLYVWRLNLDKGYVRLSRRITPEQAARVAELNLEGLGFEPEQKRFYPHGTLAAHALGFVNDEHLGGSGVEARFQPDIGGQAGLVLVHHDRDKAAFAKDVLIAPTAGASVELTIDKNIQHIAERELKAAIDAYGALSGTAIVMDPWTNELLALANHPTYDPNAWKQAKAAAMVNRGVLHFYEPGSTFKLVTGAAALEQNVVESDDMIDVSEGVIRFGRDVIRDDHKHDALSFADVIVKSSNVGAIKVALNLGAESLVGYARKFGFGRRLTLDFGGESPGIVHDAATLKPSELARVAMGYQVGVTPLQMAAAVSSIANGGELLQPRLVRAFIKDGKRQEVPRVVLNRTVDAATAAEMTSIMERVVTHGTGTAAQVPGYTVAGKTGTAQKLIDRAYSQTHYFASFVGFVPSRNPKYTIVVVIDSPLVRKGYYGGTVAAPAFRRIAEAVLRYSGVPPTLNAPPPVLVRRGGHVPHEVRTSGPSAGSVAAPAGVSGSTFPDFTGVSAREALVTLTRLGMTARLRGSGPVVDQRPAPGTPLEAGGVATLWLGRKPAVSRVADSSAR